MAVLHDAIRAESRAETGHRAYAVTLQAGVSPRAAAEAALFLGFDSLLALSATPEDPAGDASPDGLEALAEAAHAHGLHAYAALSLGSVSPNHPLATQTAPGAFGARRLLPVAVVDPRRPAPRGDGAVPLRHPANPAISAWWQERLHALTKIGLDGAACVDPGLAAAMLAHVLQNAGNRIVTLSRTPGGEGHVLIASHAGQAAAGRCLLADVAMNETGWALEAGAEAGIEETVRGVNRILRDRAREGLGQSRAWTGAGAKLAITSRALGEAALVLVRNRANVPASFPPLRLPPMPWQQFSPICGFADPANIAPGDVVLLEARANPPAPLRVALTAAQAAEPARRVVITRVSPSVDAGAFAVKRVIGETLRVEADIFADGHEQIAAAVLLRAEGETAWTSYAMAPQPNDAWAASPRVTRLGRHFIVVQAWIDIWAGFVRDLTRKQEAGQDLSLEFREAHAMLEAALPRASAACAADLRAAMVTLGGADARAKYTALISAAVTAAMAEADDRHFLTNSFVQPIEVEREAAQFSSWYEIFPRSQSPVPGQHGTFSDVIARLPHIAAMGFDTLYFPPIHPIGERNRKGPNNAVTAAPGDFGSPYAIGSADGGHEAIHKQLGSFEDFRALVEQAAAHGLEIALDFAIQCAPDHPWLKQHPGWFAWRPDGSIKYAENPPKKYQDIVNVDFYANGAVPELWHALRDVVLFWADEGIRTFRVDNPHTKPLPFWAWLIASVKARYPEAIFLSEAFTRPKPMYQLAKAGFSQSYTYFTWRNDKAALTEYVNELTQTGVRDFFRPHFFVNTPDINPLFLQTSGRPGFLIRAALAATLSGLWGVYAGFELCESAPLPGREEYLDSEKYQLRTRPERAPGDIVAEITQLNRLRLAEPALRTHLGTEFHTAYNDQILYYSKAAPGDAGLILIAVSLDPFAPQEATFEVPLWLFGLPDWQTVDVDDLLHDQHFSWTGKLQHMRLTQDAPYAIWRVTPQAQA
jgi:starch synthase (maltosyl-transferring)